MRICSAFVLTLSVLLAGCATSHTTPPQAPLAWMEGDWVAEAWGGSLEARYVTDDQGFAIGSTQLIKDGAPVYHEFEVFSVTGDAGWLVPHPGGKPSERFELTERSAQRIVFEHTEKDFPTRISYERQGSQLLIELSDPHGDSGKSEVFRFTQRDRNQP